MNIDSPRCFGTFQSVRASIRPWVATSPPDVQILEPLITQVSPSRVARVSAPARSEPPDGSDSSCTKISSARRIAGRCRAFCASVPQSRIVAPSIPIDTAK